MNILVPVVHFFIFRLVNIINLLERLFAKSESLYKLLLIPGFETFRWGIGAWRAWYNFGRAYKSVPAYRDFIDAHGGKPRIMLRNNMMPSLQLIPEMDKVNYIKVYPNEARVRGGKLPRKGVMVDESSGSSGKPTSWVRGPVERALTKEMLQLSYHRAMGTKGQTFIVNAFALGAWATGLNVTMCLTEISIIKSTGPDIDKIVNTLLEFGPGYHYIIMGYPPFLKTLADDERLDWKQYKADAIFGGEGISESMRDYLLKTFNQVIGSYGASDLEINVAAENAFTITLRRMLLEDEAVREALTFTDFGVTPMVFQYNPLAYYMETNDKAELLVTLCRPTNIAPKIRYNIHDRGHVLRYELLKKKLKEIGKWDKFKDLPGKVDLPILFLYGRSDMSVDYYGANVTPDSIREILYGIKDLASKLSTFRLLSYENKKSDKLMHIAIELCKDKTDNYDHKNLAEEVLTKLAAINKDFYNAYYHTATADQHPKVSIHEYGTGPFAGGQRKLKNEYVATELKYDKL
ncbi:MAG: CoF synthetase [Patescibacteria group bacterium]